MKRKSVELNPMNECCCCCCCFYCSRNKYNK